MAKAMVALANITLGSAQAAVTFSSIPATYRDLYLVINAKNTASAQGLQVQFNDDAASNYSYVVMYGNGSSPSSGASASQAYADFGINRTTDTSTLAHILDYSATDKHKTVLVRSDNASELSLAYVNRWASTSAIAKIKISASANSLTAGSTFALYGVVA